MEKSTAQGGLLIGLNVGGTKYVTTEATLRSPFGTSQNFFTLLLDNLTESKLAIQRDSEGNIFIDRNGRVFEVVLDFLRTGKLFIPPTITREQVACEFDFYQLPMPTQHDDAAECAKSEICNLNSVRNIAREFIRAHAREIEQAIRQRSGYIPLRQPLDGLVEAIVKQEISKQLGGDIKIDLHLEPTSLAYWRLKIIVLR